MPRPSSEDLYPLTLPPMPLIRMYPRTLTKPQENALVDEIVKSIDEHPERWSMTTYHLTDGNIKIWLPNERYADMNIEAPYKVNIGFWNARRLRAAKRRFILREWSRNAPG